MSPSISRPVVTEAFPRGGLIPGLLLMLAGCASIGADAIKLMTPEDLAILETLRGYSVQTTKREIIADFGTPIKWAGSIRPV